MKNYKQRSKFNTSIKRQSQQEKDNPDVYAEVEQEIKRQSDSISNMIKKFEEELKEEKRRLERQKLEQTPLGKLAKRINKLNREERLKKAAENTWTATDTAITSDYQFTYTINSNKKTSGTLE